MAIKQGWDFEASHGFTASAGQTIVKGYARGGKVAKDDCFAKGGKIGPVKKGALHKELGIKQGEKIPASRLAAAKKSSNPLERKRATFAQNAKKWAHKAKGGRIEQAEAGKGKGGPDLKVGFPGNHLAYKKGGMVEKECDGGPINRAKGGMSRPMGMPRAPVIGMKRMRHPGGMPGGMNKPMPSVPGMPAAGTAPMGLPGAPGSPPRVMNRGGKSK